MPTDVLPEPFLPVRSRGASWLRTLLFAAVLGYSLYWIGLLLRQHLDGRAVAASPVWPANLEQP